jgi:hypothetical protein
VLALEPHRVLAAPREADDLDRLRERLERLPGTALRAAHRGDALPEGACAEPELEAPAGEPVERSRRLGDHGGQPERQVGHVGEDADPLRLGEQRRHQHPGLQEAALVGMILDAEKVEPGPVGGTDERPRAVEVVRSGHDGDPELERPPRRHAPFLPAAAEFGAGRALL